jgi:hypothetical protein
VSHLPVPAAHVIIIRSAGANTNANGTSPGLILFVFALPVVELSLVHGPRINLGSIIVMIPHIMDDSHVSGMIHSVLTTQSADSSSRSIVILWRLLPLSGLPFCLFVIQSADSSSRSIVILWRLLPLSGLPFCLLVIFAVHSALSAGILLSVSVHSCIGL